MIDEAEQRKAQTAAMFNRLAADYDIAGVSCFAYFGHRLVEHAQVQPGQAVLDIATGRGAVLLPAAEHVGPAGRAVGIDLAEAMVEATRRELSARDLSADLRVMDAEQLEFPDQSFDHVLCGFGLMFFPHLEATLREIRRVLRPGGRIGASTWKVSQTHDLTLVLDELGTAGPSPPGWITDPNQLSHLLGKAEFTDIEVRTESTTFRYADLDQYWQTALGTGERRRLAALDRDQLDAVRRTLAQRLRDRQDTDALHVEASALFALASNAARSVQSQRFVSS